MASTVENSVYVLGIAIAIENRLIFNFQTYYPILVLSLKYPLTLCFYTGGRLTNYQFVDGILTYDATSDIWIPVGRLTERKGYHAVTPIKDVDQDVCI